MTRATSMKNSLMAMADKIALRKRSVIQTVNDELKNMCQTEHSRHRLFGNFITNLIAYAFFPKKPSIRYGNLLNTSYLQAENQPHILALSVFAEIQFPSSKNQKS